VYTSDVQRKSIVYKTAKGVEPYVDYVDSLRDRQAATKIKVRVTRAEMGNLGDHRTVGQGIIELRIDFGPGYRVYAALHGNELIVLLSAGDKSTQEKDIAKAHEYWDDFRRNL
jgi:putative addiction module killer protein